MAKAVRQSFQADRVPNVRLESLTYARRLKCHVFLSLTPACRLRRENRIDLDQKLAGDHRRNWEGPSDVETSWSAEGRERARRSYREVYEEYRKLSEAVLDSEPIPLGHRQTIRRYFESIRPQKDDGTEADLNSGGE